MVVLKGKLNAGARLEWLAQILVHIEVPLGPHRFFLALGNALLTPNSELILALKHRIRTSLQ
jgi:hypothetical protein